MVDGPTRRPTHNPHEPPDHVRQVVGTVRSLSNKYVPTPSLDKIKVNLLQGLKDFCHRARKRATAIHLCKGTVAAPALRPTYSLGISDLPNDASDIDSWHDGQPPDDVEHDQYGLRSNLYDQISAYPEADSDQTWLEAFLNKLEWTVVQQIRALCKEDT